MKYTVVRHFTDMLDNNHKYREGYIYPRTGYTPSAERIADLSSKFNRQKTVLISPFKEEISEPEPVEVSAAEELAEEITAETSDENVQAEEPTKKKRKKTDE